MDERLGHILQLVVEKAVETGEPVGSQFLVDECGLDVSPATVRNYFAALEEGGYIMHPHTSSGRLPTEKGYREYVNTLMKSKNLNKKEVGLLSEASKATKEDNLRLKAMAKLAAELSENAVILGLGTSDSYYTGLTNLFSQSEFKDWNRIVSMSDVLDRLDDVLTKLRHVRFEEPTTLIGGECPFGSMCGSVVVTTPQGCLIGILGPMRMDYAQAISLMKKMQELLTI
ncbi:MAG: hypothetical protein WC766_01095 [Patescibacteria group bacterium]|jgi:heat-inducible transcriptional repressor